MKSYYEIDHHSGLKDYRAPNGRLVCIIHHIRKALLAEYNLQYIYNLDSMIEVMRNPVNSISYMGDSHHTVNYISTYRIDHLDISKNQFTRRMEIK